MSGGRHAALIAVCAASACTFGEVDLTGKSCPCGQGWICDEVRNVCVTEAGTDAGGGDAATLDAPAPDAAALDAGLEDAGFEDSGPPDAGRPCLMHEDCDDTEVCDPLLGCLAGESCLRDDQCVPGPPEQVCDRTRMFCVRGQLASGTRCNVDAQCTSRYCLSLTNSTTGSHKFCSQGCSASADCPDLLSCQPVSSMSFCIAPFTFDPPPVWTTPSGGACAMGANECHSGICDTGINTCVEGCSRHSDCSAFGMNCQVINIGANLRQICRLPGAGTSSTGVACMSDADCASRVCDRAAFRCAEPCCSEADCADGESCAPYDHSPEDGVKICRPRSPGVGTLSLGASCSGPLMCESEVCAPNEVLGATALVCSTTCCSDADCDVFPLGGLCYPAAYETSGVFVRSSPVPGMISGVCVPN